MTSIGPHWLRLLAGALALFLAVPTLAQQAAAEAPRREILVMISLPPAHFRPNSGYGGNYGDSLSRTANRKVANGIARRHGVDMVDSWPMPLLGIDCYVLRLREGQDADATIAAFNRDPAVRWAQPMQIYQAQAAPRRDPLYPVQPAARWRLDDLHRVATGRGIRVAVIDSQVDVRHPDLLGQVVVDRNFVTGRPAAAEAHGTGIAGVIAAKANNGLGIAGIAPDARLVALRACWQSDDRTLCDTLSLAKALEFAVAGRTPIINVSLAGPPDRLLGSLIDLALARGSTVVAAYDGGLPEGGFPASKAGVIAVADARLKARPATVYGAPGTDVPTTLPKGRWSVVSGSSFAAAHVSGLVALIRQQRPAGKVHFTTLAGSGHEIDACSTLMGASPACDCCTLAQVAAPSRR